MQKFRRILYVVYLIFHLGILASVLHLQHLFSVRSEEFQYLLYMAIAGIFLFFVDLIADQIIDRNQNKEIEQLEDEKNEAKAKMFDLQEKENIELSSQPHSEEKENSDDHTSHS